MAASDDKGRLIGHVAVAQVCIIGSYFASRITHFVAHHNGVVQIAVLVVLYHAIAQKYHLGTQYIVAVCIDCTHDLKITTTGGSTGKEHRRKTYVARHRSAESAIRDRGSHRWFHFQEFGANMVAVVQSNFMLDHISTGR